MRIDTARSVNIDAWLNPLRFQTSLWSLAASTWSIVHSGAVPLQETHLQREHRFWTPLAVDLGRRVRHSSCLSKNPGITAGTDQL
jgi:hypothetical protein